MRLLRRNSRDEISLTGDLAEHERPPYAILSHCWAENNSDEVLLAEVETSEGRNKPGYQKIQFCAEQARKDGLNHFWVDTCCIDKRNLVELSEAITSMYRWYRDAVKCYVYLPDVSCQHLDNTHNTYSVWAPQFEASRWFTRGWTLQELLASKTVEFFSREKAILGTKTTLAAQIQRITSIPIGAFHGADIHHFAIPERMRWIERRKTGKPEDRAYCMLGIFGVSMSIIYGEGEQEAFRRLQREIQERSGATTRSPHTHWLVRRTANSLFTGRQDLLHRLEKIVRDAVDCPWHQPQCRIVISGIGGQGKSEVCLQLSQRLRQMYVSNKYGNLANKCLSFWAVIWIDMGTKEIAERSFVAAAKQLSLPHSDWEEALSSIANLQHSWLLVLDNADDPAVDYQHYFPDSPRGVVLMTTRNDEFQQYSTEPGSAVSLEGLEVTEAQKLLLQASRLPFSEHSQHFEAAQQVATLLRSHPLALIQAGSYVSRGYCTLANYPNVYEQQRWRLMTFHPVQARSRYSDVYATFEVSAMMLDNMSTQVSHDALQLLPLFAVCAPNHFPLSLFEAGWKGAQEVPSDLNDNAEDEAITLLTPWHVRQLPSICHACSKAWDAFRLMEAVNLLRAFALVSVNTHEGSILVSLHPLVHAWARDRQNQQQQQQAWLQMGCTTAFAVNQESLTQEQRRRLQPHVEALISWPIGEIFSAGSLVLVARILVCCGWFLYKQRADAKLLTLLHDMLTALSLPRVEVQGEWIGIYDIYGRALWSHGSTMEAVALLEKVVEIRSRTLAAEHPSRLASQHELAGAYKDNGQVKKAVILLEKVVEIYEQTLAAEDPSRLTSQHALAITYQANGQVKEAVILLEKLVEIRNRTLATEHPARLSSQHALASVYEANGQVEEAVTLLEKVVKIEERTLAAEHPSRLASQHALAEAYQANGQVQEAVTLLEKVVEIKKRTLAAEHPSRLASQHNLATYYWMMGLRTMAFSIMSEVVSIRQRVLDANHPDRQVSERCLTILEEKMAGLDVD